VLRYPASALDEALRESQSLRSKLLGGMAARLRQVADDALDLLAGTDVITRLVQGEQDADDFIAVSARMRSLGKRIDRCAQVRSPVLLIGEPGTGKDPARPARPPRVGAIGRPAHRGQLCPARSPGCSGTDPWRRQCRTRTETAGRGIGGVHFADGRDPSAFGISTPSTTRYRISWPGTLLEVATRVDAGGLPDTRIVATVQRGSSRGDAERGLTPALLEQFEHVLQIPSLADRPRDILPLAEAVLARFGRPAKRLSETARHALLSMPYRRHNVAELQEVSAWRRGWPPMMRSAPSTSSVASARRGSCRGWTLHRALVVPGMVTTRRGAGAAGRHRPGFRGGDSVVPRLLRRR
jgi:hypothetical protein